MKNDKPKVFSETSETNQEIQYKITILREQNWNRWRRNIIFSEMIVNIK